MNKEFWIALGKRALRTFCQAALATIGTANLIDKVNWMEVLSASCLAAIISALMSIVTGLPEAAFDPPAEDEANADTAPAVTATTSIHQEKKKPPDMHGCEGCMYLLDGGECVNKWETLCQRNGFAWRKEKEIRSQTISSIDQALDLEPQEER